MTATETPPVWEIKEYFEKTGTFPEMTEDAQNYFLEFAKSNLKDTIQAYERYTHDHGGLRDEAKQMFKEIESAEKMHKAIKKLTDETEFNKKLNAGLDAFDVRPWK